METNKIYQGDCLELMKQIEDKSVDLILCDLPYGTTACSWDVIIPFDKLWEQYKRIIKDNGAIVLFATQPFTTKLINSAMDMFKYDIIWEKSRSTDFMNSKNKICRRHEEILIFSKGVTANGGKCMMKFNPQMEEGKPYKRVMKSDPRVNTMGIRKKSMAGITLENNGSRYPSSILFCNNPNNNNLHPTQKPVALFEYLIKTYTNEGDLVLDNCIGSGTTAIACINTNRRFIGMELSEEYCKIANDRIQKELSQTKLNSEGKFFSSQP